MFGLFKPVFYQDPTLGPLKRCGRQWEGTISLLGGDPVELELDGDRKAPFPAALAAAHELPKRMPSLVPLVASGLLEHLAPYQEALLEDTEFREAMMAEHEEPETLEQIMQIKTPEQAFAAAYLAGVECGPADGKTRLLVKFRTPWDIEHTLGAYFDDWEFLELNGSV